MSRLTAAPFALVATACAALAATDIFRGVDAYRLVERINARAPSRESLPFLALDAAWVLQFMEVTLMVSAIVLLGTLALTRHLPIAHRRALVAAVAALGVAVVVGALALALPRGPSEPWGARYVLRVLPLVAVPVALAWPMRAARPLALAGAGFLALRAFAMGWASDAYVRSSAFTSAGAVIPADLLAWMVLPFAAGFAGYVLVAAAFLVATMEASRRDARPVGAEAAPAGA